MIAASASEMVSHTASPIEPDIGVSNSDMPPKQFDGEVSRTGSNWPTHQLSAADQKLFESLQEHDPTLTAAVTQRAATYPRPIAMNPNSEAKGFVNDFGNSTKPTKPKVRGRFSASRRKEVQEVRKRGACIRCRMLKKPV
jgi:hypothetical protein